MKRLLINCKTAEGLVNILIEDELITYVGTEQPVHDELLDLTGKIVLSGMIDPHVHVRDMEQAEKETWQTASMAAVAGGITTIMDMPNTKPATTNLVGLEAKRKVAEESYVHHYLHLGATSSNLEELREILLTNPLDVVGIKVFLAGSSSNEVVTDPIILEAIFTLAKEFDKVVLVHTELQPILDSWQKQAPEETIHFHNMMRHREAAIEGTKLVLKIAQKVRNKLYLCHVSTHDEIKLITKAKADNNNIFAEVTPHHLFLNDKMLKTLGNFGKVNPPLRGENDNETLKQAVIDGIIDCIGTDHAPHTLDEKLNDYPQAPSGFPGLETAIPITYNLVLDGIISLARYEELISGKAAKIFGIEFAGSIAEGNRADLTVLDPQDFPPIISGWFNSKAKYSPFDGFTAAASIAYTFVNGEMYEI